ncbi:ninein-like protein isoform X2 [Gigantopelta aegis]|uniref:ninein-like protein isoform X2 n=1 Tax=Gigantopelta aegis TaxID=1735272 RepID=UPI001B888334|nr:ninein-like protein isoform X2 [Gigantopelta aegis]
MDEYSSQLHDVFISCDTSGSGYLGPEEIQVLCSKLQIDSYSSLLGQRLFDGQLTDKVDFEKFQQVFLEVLQYVQDQQPEEPNQAFGEVTPKYVNKNKKYGRRSKPDCLSTLNTGLAINSPQGSESPKPSRIPRHVSRISSKGDEFQVKKAKKEYYDDDDETFEAEGQLSTPGTETRTQAGSEQLEDVWTKLGFSKNSSIDIRQFAKFAEYVDMGDMDDEKLQHLFDKLDTDHDGRLTLRDFIGGHRRSSLLKRPSGRMSQSPQHNAQCTPSDSRRMTPRTMATSKKLFPSPGSEKRNSSVLSSNGLNGIFSCIDPNETGFANVDDVIDLWESLSIPDASTLLQDLGITLGARVNLEELTSLIDQAVSDADIDVYCQLALLMCEHEIQYRRSFYNKVKQERDKFQLDLREANARNAILAKEFDDRHVQMEKSTEAQLLSIEQKYQEQIAKLQQHLDAAMEEQTFESEKFDSTLSQFKDEELKLKEQLVHFQKEVGKLEAEVTDLSEKLSQAESERMNLLKDLEHMEHLQKKQPDYDREELENSIRVLQEKLDRLLEENKNLKDKNDELIGELEVAKQQSMMRKPRRSLPSTAMSMIPVRDGMSLSEYFTKRRNSLTSITSNDAFEVDEDEQNFLNRHKNRQQFMDTPSQSFDDDSGSEPQSLSNSMKISLLENDEKEREHLFRVEIAVLEEQHCREKQELRQQFEAEKARLCEKLEHEKQDALAELQKELQTAFVMEKQDLLERYETEKNLILHNMATLKEKPDESIQDRIVELEEENRQKLQSLQTELEDRQTVIESLERSLADLRLRFKLQEEELQQECDRQLDEKDEQMKLKIKQLEAQHALQIMDYEDMLNGGFDALRGKLREDFLTLLKEETDSAVAVHQVNMRNEMEALQLRLESEYSAKVAAIQRQQEELEVERMAMLRQLQHDIDSLESQRTNMLKQQRHTDLLEVERANMLENSFDDERSAICDRHNEEIKRMKQELVDEFDKERTALMQNYEDRIAQMREQLGDLRACVDAERSQHSEQLARQHESIERELTQQIRRALMDELQNAFEEENRQLERKIEVLQAEISELKSVIENKDKTIIELREKLSEIDSQRQQLEIEAESCKNDTLLLSPTDELLLEKEQLEKCNCDMEREIDSLVLEREEFLKCRTDMQLKMDKLVSEKEELVQCRTDMQNELDKLVSEKDELEQCKRDMQCEIDNLMSEKEILIQCRTDLQTEIEEFVSEKKVFEEEKTEMQSEINWLKSEKPHSTPFEQQSLLADNERLKCRLQQTLQQMEELSRNMEQKNGILQTQLCDLQKNQLDLSKLKEENYDLQLQLESLQTQLNDSGLMKHQKEKDKRGVVLERNITLKRLLQETTDKLLTVISALASSQSKHMREIEEWKKKTKDVSHVENFTKHQMGLAEQQHQLMDLQALSIENTDVMHRVLFETEERHRNKILLLEAERNRLKMELQSTRSQLSDNCEKMKNIFEVCAEKTLMIKKVMVENSDLVKRLQVTEQRQKEAERKYIDLSKTNATLKRILKQVYQACP